MSASVLDGDGNLFAAVAQLETKRSNGEASEDLGLYAVYFGPDGPESRPHVLLTAHPDMCSISIRLSPDTAREMAQALLKAADLVDAVKEELRRNKLFPQEV